MATEYPALNRIHVVGYSANDTDYPILGLVADPRVVGYKVPEDFSVCPDKRYPNHIFTGAQPISGDQRVRHTWEILPSPWVPFTRYDDDLGPVQGRRRSVKNEGQKASLTSSTKISYEGREGSAIVSNEIEETWQIKVDDDGNSLFPVKIRDFYDASRGAVEERRQLFVPTGEEVATLENVNGIITQTSYEPYNEYLSYKVVQTYAVDGPQLVGSSTNNDGQLVTVTTQRKAADNYTPPQPTATRTVEVSREDIESLVERVIDTPEVFAGKTFQVSKVDTTPQKFRAAQQDVTFEQTIEGEASQPTLASGEFSKSEQQINKFLKRVATNSRAINQVVVLLEKVLTPERQIATRTLRLSSGDQTFTPSATLIDANVEALGDGRTVKTEITVPNLFPNKVKRKEKIDTVPDKFRAGSFITTSSITEAVSDFEDPPEDSYDGFTSESITVHTLRNSTTNKVNKVDQFQSIIGADFDPLVNIQIPFTEKIVSSSIPTGPIEADGIGDDKIVIKQYDLSKISNALENIFTESPSRISMTLPPVLKSVEILWNINAADGETSVNGQGSGEGSSGTVSMSGRASGNGRADVDPELFADFEEFYASNIPTTSCSFFIKEPTESSIVGKISNKVSGIQGMWPILKPKSHTFYATIQSVARDVSIGVSASQSWSENNISTSTDNSKGFTISTETKYKIFKVPPCLHDSLLINSKEKADVWVNASATLTLPKGGSINVPAPQQGSAQASGDISYNFGSTNPVDIPRSGKYIVDVKIDPYRFGYYRVYAEILDASFFDKNTN